MKGHCIHILIFLLGNFTVAFGFHRAHQNPFHLQGTWGHQFTQKKSPEKLEIITQFIKNHQQELLPALTAADQEVPSQTTLTEQEILLLPTIYTNSPEKTLWNQLAEHPIVIGIRTGNLAEEDRKKLIDAKLIDEKPDHSHDKPLPIKLNGSLPSLVVLNKKNINFLSQFANLEQLEFIVRLYTARLISLQSHGNGVVVLSEQDKALFNSLELTMRQNIEKNYVLQFPDKLRFLKAALNLKIVITCIMIGTYFCIM